MAFLLGYELKWQENVFFVSRWGDHLREFIQNSNRIDQLDEIRVRCGYPGDADYMKKLVPPPGEIRIWLVDQGSNPVGPGQHKTWTCLMSDNQGFAFRMRWL
jgi:hypothetical protein